MDMLSGIVATSIRLEEQAKILTGPTSDLPTYLPAYLPLPLLCYFTYNSSYLAPNSLLSRHGKCGEGLENKNF